MTTATTLVLANHRPEAIPLTSLLMAAHGTINLEEPADNRLHHQGRFQADDFFVARALVCNKLILRDEITSGEN